MRKSLLTVATMMLLAFGLTASAANFKVGILDMHKIMTDSPQVQKIKENLQSQFKPREEKLVEARDTLKADADKLRKDAAILSKTDRENLQRKIITEQRALQQKQMTFQQEAMKAQNTEMKSLIDQVRTVAKQVATKKQLNVVITTDTALYFDQGLDITNQVLAKLKQAS